MFHLFRYTRAKRITSRQKKHCVRLPLTILDLTGYTDILVTITFRWAEAEAEAEASLHNVITIIIVAVHHLQTRQCSRNFLEGR